MRCRLACAALAAFAWPACGPTDEPQEDVRPKCLEAVDLDCKPLIDPPTFPKLFTNTFNKTCASEGVSCHGEKGHQGGLIFEDEAEAEGLLLGKGSAPARVIPGDPRCSELIVRLDSPGHSWSMPPDDPLAENARCAIRLWVQSLEEEP